MTSREQPSRLSVVQVKLSEARDPEYPGSPQRVHIVTANRPLWNEEGKPTRDAITLERVLGHCSLKYSQQPRAVPGTPNVMRFMDNELSSLSSIPRYKVNDFNERLETDTPPDVRVRWHEHLPGMLVAHRNVQITPLAVEAVSNLPEVQIAKIIPNEADPFMSMYEYETLLAVLAKPDAPMQNVQLKVQEVLQF